MSLRLFIIFIGILRVFIEGKTRKSMNSRHIAFKKRVSVIKKRRLSTVARKIKQLKKASGADVFNEAAMDSS